MKAFVSWSGGKDCMYAMHQFLKEEKNFVSSLINMCSNVGVRPSAHGLDKSLIQRQAEAIAMPIIQPLVEKNNYEYSFKKAIENLIDTQSIDSGVFGDIYLEAHRQWIERVCQDMGIKAVFPLWEIDTFDIINRFLDEGFKTIVVSVRKGKLDKKYLGRMIDTRFVEELKSLKDIDICGENGEYHSYVFDGPIFKHPINFDITGYSEDDNHYFIDIK